MNFTFNSIGIFHTDAHFAYDVPRQGCLAKDNIGRIDLEPGHDYASAARDLAGIERIWLLFVFDRNINDWHPLVRPPHHTTRKIGVFATRAPYRPNPIGLSCVPLLKVESNRIYVQAHDLLDGTPILDIKPYLPFADAFPDSAAGWIDTAEELYEIVFAPAAETQLKWLEAHGVVRMRSFIETQLAVSPGDRKRHRITAPGVLAYRTWRAAYSIDAAAHRVTISAICSGYSQNDLTDGTDRYQDKILHQEFISAFS